MVMGFSAEYLFAAAMFGLVMFLLGWLAATIRNGRKSRRPQVVAGESAPGRNGRPEGRHRKGAGLSLVESPIGGPSPETEPEPQEEPFLVRFDAIVKKNIANPNLDVQYIADVLATSRTALFNKVRESTGMNLQNYINKCRMEKAMELIKTTSLPLSEIAQKSGFATPRYFSTAFKNYTGITPSEYKKKTGS